MGFPFHGGWGHIHPSKPTSAKTAGADTTFDFKIRENVRLTTISIKDADEILNGTEVAISIRSSTGKLDLDLPGGQCGGTTIYYWSGDVPIPENSILRIILDGPTASTPRIRATTVLKEEQ